MASRTCCGVVAVDQADVQRQRRRRPRTPRGSAARGRCRARRRAPRSGRRCWRRAAGPTTSSATWASASSAGMNAEPCPRAPSARSSAANASPSARPASATSASASPGAARARARTGRCGASSAEQVVEDGDARWRRSPRRYRARPGRSCARVTLESRRGRPRALAAARRRRARSTRRARAAARRSARSRGRSRRRCRSSDVPSAQSAAISIAMPGADVRARQPLAVELRRAGDDGAVRVAEDDPGAHADELVDEEEAALEHLLEDEHRAVRLRRRSTTAIDVRSAGNAGQGPSSIFGIWPPRSSWITSSLARRHAHASTPPTSTSTPSRSNAGRIESRSLGSTSSIVMSPPVDRGEADEARRPRCAPAPTRQSPPSSSVDAVDPQHVRLDPLDLGAERDEEAAEVLDVRLAGGVPDHRLALGEHGGHDDVLGRHHARLVEEDRLAAQPRRAHLVARRRSRSRRRARRSAWMCGSSRRRPITSPPGGGTVALPKRASSGPASRNEARMRRQSSSSSSVL